MLVDRAHRDRRLLVRTQAGEPDEHYARMNLALPKDQLPEILIRGKQHCLIRVRSRQHFWVVHARRQLRDVCYFVTVAPQLFDDLRVNAFVSDELHDTSSDTG